VIVVDSVVMAIGQFTDKDMMNETNNKGVFTAGDCVTGSDLVVTAVAAGRKVAASMHQFLMGAEIVGEKPTFSSQCGPLETLPEEMFSAYPKVPRTLIPEPSIEVRRITFDDLEGSVSQDEMIQEALRCMSCGCKVAETCDFRRDSAEAGAMQSLSGQHRTYQKDKSHAKIQLETDKCIQCGACVRVCDEIKQFHSLGYVGRGFGSRIEPQLGKPLGQSNCDGCGQCVEVCPTAGVVIA
jgi:formate dehydrogenase major subunit